MFQKYFDVAVAVLYSPIFFTLVLLDKIKK